MIDTATSTGSAEIRSTGTQMAVVTMKGFVANPSPGLSFVRLLDEVRHRPHWSVPRLVYLLATKLCTPPLQGPELDTLNTLVALEVFASFISSAIFSGGRKRLQWFQVRVSTGITPR